MKLARVEFLHSHEIKVDSKEWHHKEGFNLGAKVQLESCEAEITNLKNEVEALHRERKGEVWYWMGDGNDHIESLSCPILIEPEDFKAEIRKLFEEIEEHDCWRTFDDGQLCIIMEGAEWQALKERWLK